MTLTARQTDVLGLLARGLTKKEVAYLLGISESTVMSHARDVRVTLNARNTAHAVAIGLRNRLIVG